MMFLLNRPRRRIIPTTVSALAIQSGPLPTTAVKRPRPGLVAADDLFCLPAIASVPVPDLPLEIQLLILECLSLNEQFRIAVNCLRKTLYHVKRNVLPRLPEARIDAASKRGLIDLLNWWKESGLPLVYTNESMNKAPTMSLSWWVSSGLPLKFSDQLFADIVVDCCHDPLEMYTRLEWWRNSGLVKKIPEQAFMFKEAFIKGLPEFLKWCKASGLQMCIPDSFIDELHSYGPPSEIAGIMDLWKSMGLPLIYSSAAIDLLGRRNCPESDVIEILEWWKQSGLQLKYTVNHMDFPSGPLSLSWWKESGLELKYSGRALWYASFLKRFDVLNWWKDSGLPLRYGVNVIDDMSGLAEVEALQWWKDSGLELKYTANAMRSASLRGYTSVLEWWKNSGLPLKWDVSVLSDVAQTGQLCQHVLSWWWKSGLVDRQEFFTHVRIGHMARW